MRAVSEIVQISLRHEALVINHARAPPAGLGKIRMLVNSAIDYRDTNSAPVQTILLRNGGIHGGGTVVQTCGHDTVRSHKNNVQQIGDQQNDCVRKRRRACGKRRVLILYGPSEGRDLEQVQQAGSSLELNDYVRGA